MSLNLDDHLQTLRGGGCIPERQIRMIVEKVKEILVEESNVQPISAPVTLCGDIHG